MDKSKGSGSGLDKFFAGKGFYIVLFLCAAIIGVSAWSLISRGMTVEEAGENDYSLGYPQYTVQPAEPTADPNDEVMWEIPEGTEELPALVEAPEVQNAGLNEPESFEEAARTFLWPVIGQIDRPYSVDALLYDQTMGDWRVHDGMDIQAELGSRVLSVSAGTVTEIRGDDLYGTTVVIDHGDGLISVYSNLAELPTVSVGDSVLAGETIGSVGDTALGEVGQVYHLHFAMRLYGESVDPLIYLPVL